MKPFRRKMMVTVTALAAAALVASWSAGDQRTLERLLPSGKAIRAGWVRAPDSLQYAAGEHLTEIYDGGYQLYLDSGVLDAAQIGYQSKAGYCSLTVHTMKSPQACRAFFDHWRKEAADQGKLTTLPLADASFVYHPVAKTTYGYLRNGRFLLTADVNIGGEIGRTVLRSFMEAVSKAATEAQRPPRRKAKGA
jgi:hypothetical protein